jgi:hypothetical protein
MGNMGSPPSSPFRRRLAGFAALYVMGAVAAIVYTAPPFPRSAGGWMALLLLGPPLYLFAEWAGEKLSDDWDERSRLAKFLKATLLVVLAVSMIVVLTVIKES